MKFFTLDDLSKITSYKIPDDISEYQFLYNFISANKDFILENCTIFSYADLWYNEYYWLLCEEYLRYKKTGFDAGLEQMIFNLFETASNEIDIDWNIIKDLETKAKKNDFGVKPMRAVIQRVTNASVTVDGEVKGSIESGFLILLGVENGDDELEARTLAAKIAGLRIFTDENDKMNLSLLDINGSALVISNFTLCADARKGRRPNFSNAAMPDTANPLYEYFCECLRENGVSRVEQGVFGADMKVQLLNDGPVTLVIDSRDLAKH